MRINGLTWVVLVALSAVSLRAAESGADAGRVGHLLILAAVLKSLLLGWQFMELRAAHPLWRAGFALLLAGYMVSVHLLSSPPGQ